MRQLGRGQIVLLVIGVALVARWSVGATVPQIVATVVPEVVKTVVPAVVTPVAAAIPHHH